MVGTNKLALLPALALLFLLAAQAGTAHRKLLSMLHRHRLELLLRANQATRCALVSRS
jgi:hypothetical protein